MHYAKFNNGKISGLFLHTNRGIEKPDTHSHSNEKIDPAKTHLNYDLKERAGVSPYEYYKKRIEDIATETKERTGKKLRKDAVTLCGWVITAPKDLPKDSQSEFFLGVYDFFSRRYGSDNVVTAVVHMDETTPHMHFQFTPIITRDGARRLCAADLETKKSLSAAHRDLQSVLEKKLDCSVNLLNGATNDGNKEVRQLKLETAQQEIRTAERKSQEANATLDVLENEILEKKGDVESILGEIEKKNRELKSVKAEVEKQKKMLVSEEDIASVNKKLGREEIKLLGHGDKIKNPEYLDKLIKNFLILKKEHEESGQYLQKNKVSISKSQTQKPMQKPQTAVSRVKLFQEFAKINQPVGKNGREDGRAKSRQPER